MLISKFDLYKREWLDLVFADRNKNYGAYDLRTHYGDNMLKALAITVVGFTVAFITISIVYKHDVVPDTPIINTTEDIPILPKLKVDKPLDPVKTKPIDKPHSKPAAATAVAPDVSTTRYVKPVITTDPVTTEPATQIDLLTTVVGSETKKGTEQGSGNVLTGKDGTGPGTADGTGKEDMTVYEGGLDALPEPYGGTGSWRKFLEKNLRYPQTEAQGRVVLSFIVEKDGHLTDITVIRSISPELDREAIRVLKLAPAWKPGTQNGKPVRVKFTVPIVFQMTE